MLRLDNLYGLELTSHENWMPLGIYKDQKKTAVVQELMQWWNLCTGKFMQLEIGGYGNWRTWYLCAGKFAKREILRNCNWKLADKEIDMTRHNQKLWRQLESCQMIICQPKKPYLHSNEKKILLELTDWICAVKLPWKLISRWTIFCLLE